MIAPCAGGSPGAVVKELFVPVPHAMASRVAKYPPLKSIEQVSLGYFQAPSKVRCVLIAWGNFKVITVNITAASFLVCVACLDLSRTGGCHQK
jgi:hypothetical protein